MRILQVFNRYVQMGGEEKSVDRIYGHLGQEHEVERCFFESRDWTKEGAPGKLGQLRRTFYNSESRAKFEKVCDAFQPDVALFHNPYPVGSPSLYHAAKLRALPVIQYMHNFRPFSVDGTLYAKGVFMEEALRGNFWREVTVGAWQGSKLKSAIMALVLRRLHRSGWLDHVKAWVCISEFLRDKLVHGAGLPAERVHALRHSWDAMPEAPAQEDGGYYLFLGRLIEAKGIEMMLETWRIVEEGMGGKAPELWIGGEGALEGIVRAAAQRSPKIKFLGQIQGREKHEAIRRCRAMLAPSIWWEPLGLVTYEAYDFAKPMLAARSGGLIETIVHGETGLLHEAGNSKNLALDVCEIEKMTVEQRVAMGAAGRKWLLANAGVDEWKRRFDEVLSTVGVQASARKQHIHHH
jgi:glycosyltransferase involved in cell wall biosynthesis